VTLEPGAPLRVLFLEDDDGDAELIVHVMQQADSPDTLARKVREVLDSVGTATTQ
jgi:hypothetical protein